MPAAPPELLDLVNEPLGEASENCRNSEANGDRQNKWETRDNFGDVVPTKDKHTLRIGFQNIGGFSTNNYKIKDSIIRRGITKWEFDVFGIAESNIDWRLVDEDLKLHARTRQWWEHLHLSTAHNTTFPGSRICQYGGTALFSINRAAHRALQRGKDEINLGRWCWTRYKGKDKHFLTVITAYRPNPPGGPFTVYAQHNNYFNSVRDPRCPRVAFLEDLAVFLQYTMDRGDHVILMLDGNTDMRCSDLSRALTQCDLREVIMERHGTNGPSTFRRNNTETPIDGIWASRGIYIQKGGYFEYDAVFLNTDHRCLWIDISFETAFGYNMSELKRLAPKRLHCRDPRLVENYHRLFQQFADKHALFDRVKSFNNKRSSMSITDIQSEYEVLDAIRCKAAEFAQSKCRKLRMGQVAFSPELNQCRRIIQAWSLLLKKASGGKVSSRLLQRTLIKVQFPPNYRGMPRTEIEDHLKAAYQNYYQKKGEATSLRQTHLENLAEAMSERGAGDKEKVIYSLIAREKQRASARRIRYLRGKQRSGGTTMVIVTDADGNQIDITDRAGLESAILRNNQEKFTQSVNTPFYSFPLKHEFGFQGVTAATQTILAGVYDSNYPLDQYILDVFQQWEMPNSIKEIRPPAMNISLESYRRFWKRANENISCFPSSLTFSTMKAGSMHEKISFIDCTLTNIPLLEGFSPSRWKNCMDVMIMKKSGVLDLSGLRTIVLFPVDCNYAFKHIGREMMKLAETGNALALEQYGSRKHHSAIDLAVNKTLTFDILRQLKRPGAICSNDAKSCYDLIGHCQASISMQRLGVPRGAVKCLFSTLQEAVHYVRTGFGDSTSSYGGRMWLVPLHGIGQGNGAGPAIWAVVSTPLLNVLRAKGFGCEFVMPLSKRWFKFVGYAFVDDTDIIQSLLCSDVTQALSSLQQAIDTWEKSLKMTCGALVPEKTVFWLISFIWHNGQWCYAPIHDSPGQLWVDDLQGDRKNIKRLETHQAYETLGVFLAPDGNLQAQVAKMHSAAIDWADHMRTGKISRSDAWLSFSSTVFRTLVYPLPALNLTRDDCYYIMQPILQYLLPAVGVCRNFSRKLVFSPLKFLGLGIKHIHTVQEIARLKSLISHVHKDTLTGRLYRTSLEAFLLELGVGFTLSTLPEALVTSHTTSTLVKSTVLFLIDHQIELRHDIAAPHPREGDCLIAKVILEHAPNSFASCNRCRLAIRALHLSDIVTGDGFEITDQAWNGVLDDCYNRDPVWPTGDKPSVADWEEWRKCLRLLFLSRGRRLKHPLGPWITLDPSWRWFRSASVPGLFSQQSGIWLVHHPGQFSRRIQKFSLQGHQYLGSLPGDLSPSKVIITPHGISSSGFSPSIPQPTHDSFLSYLRSNSSELWCFSDISFYPADLGLLAPLIQNGGLVAVSDGSYKNGAGSASWILESTDRAAHSSYRSELMGILSIFLMVDKLVTFYHVPHGIIEVACDGDSALRASSRHRYLPSTSSGPSLLSSGDLCILKDTRIVMSTWRTSHTRLS